MIVEPDRAPAPQSRQCFSGTGRSKSTFRTRDEAKRFARRTGMRDVNAYRCPECGSIHLGHRPKVRP